MSTATVRNLIIGLLITIASAAAFSFTVYTVIQKGNKLSALVATLEEQKAQEDSYLYLQHLTENTQTERDELKKYFLVGESDSIDFLTQVESLAPQLDLTIKTSDLKKITDVEKVDWIEATFSFSGSQTNVYSFIKVLESLPYVLRLTSVNVDALSSSDWKASVTMQVQIL
ncbi:MAG: hypothetical protein RLZZ230_43 [Candidatus Parcubacteria bacterium]|jgi:hypothetical protein